MLDQNQIARETVTLVLDKGSAALANTVALEEARLGWISALPWNQAPAELRSRALEELSVPSSAQPGMDAQGKWGQVVGNIVSEWTQILGLVLLTKRMIETGSTVGEALARETVQPDFDRWLEFLGLFRKLRLRGLHGTFLS
jgi:hypothetical protein